ncbi:MAG: response regulator [Candidatus Paceibacterota bacterium]
MPDQNKRSVLIIEDDIFVRDLVGIKLREAKFKVTESSDGQDGLNKLISGEHNIVLLDLMIPNKSGLDILAEFQSKKPANYNPKIIVMSNMSEQDKITECLKLGAVDYIVKAHYSPTEIVSKINQLT